MQVCGYSRSSTARERPDSIREMWVRFPSGVPISTGRRVWVIGEAGNRERVQTAHHRATDGFPSRLLSVVLFWMGRCASVIALSSSTASEHLVKTRRCGFDSRPETSKPPLVHPSNFDGSQDWVIVHNDVVAGSSPASGSRCRGSSVVEHVFPVRFLSVAISAGRRLWVIINCRLAVQIRPSASAEVAQSDRAAINIHLRFLPASFSGRAQALLMGRRHRVICHWFDSNPGCKMPR